MFQTEYSFLLQTENSFLLQTEFSFYSRPNIRFLSQTHTLQRPYLKLRKLNFRIHFTVISNEDGRIFIYFSIVTALTFLWAGNSCYTARPFVSPPQGCYRCIQRCNPLYPLFCRLVGLSMSFRTRFLSAFNPLGTRVGLFHPKNKIQNPIQH